MTQQALDLWRITHALKRRWKLLIALVTLGLISGLVLTRLEAPVYVARALVLLPHSVVEPGGPTDRSETEAHIAKSAEVLSRAGQAFTPPVSSRDLRDRVTTRVVSPDVLEVRAEAGRAADAKLLADAVADAYVTYSKEASNAESSATIAMLQSNATELEQRIRGLESDVLDATARLSELDQRSAEAVRLAAVVDSMRSAQAEALRQLALANSRMADARLSADLAGRGTRVLQPAETPREPSRPRLFWSIGVSGFIGLVAGIVLALALDRNDGRLRTRQAIAEAVGAPVVASLAAPRRISAAKCRVLVGRWQPTAVEALALRQAWTRLGIGDGRTPANIVVVTLPGDRVAPLLAVKLGAFAATHQTSTLILVGGTDGTTADLRSACSARPSRRFLSMLDFSRPVPGVELEAANLIITIVVAGDHPLEIPTLGHRTVTALAVSAGFGTPEALAAAALACGDAGHPIRGVFITNPDPSDRTTGSIAAVAAAERVEAHNGTRGQALPSPEGTAPQTAGRAIGSDLGEVIQ